MPPHIPDNQKLDAWLAGELPVEECRVFEQQLGEGGLASGELGLPDELLLGLDRERPGSCEPLNRLIDLVVTQSGENDLAPSAVSWREILEPSDDPAILGTLDHYEVLELIATGGMGIVFCARDPKLEREVAIKALAPETAANATTRERFLREARAAAKLEHENILPIHGVHDTRGVTYFSMRLATGGTLQDALDRGDSFDIDRLKSIARGVASALDAADAQGIVHRDIKPANILFDADDPEKIWVGDFGIARSTEDPSLTYGGTIAGTPQYMSPEQADGEQLDGRSDLFALGAVLYRCATGESAFPGDTTASVMKSVVRCEPKPATTFNAKLPRWFANLIANLLAKDRRDRPHGASSVIRAIDDEHAPRPKARDRRRRRLLVAACSILLLAVLLQTDFVRHVASRASAITTGRPILVESRFGAYHSLREAVASARDGDTISIRNGSTISINHVTIPENKSLTFAADGHSQRPIFTIDTPGAPGIVSQSSIVLRGFEIQIDPQADQKAILRLYGSKATLEDCLIRTPHNSVTKGKTALRAIEIIDGGDLTLDRCELDLPEFIAVAITGSRSLGPAERAPLSRVAFNDSHVVASYAVHTRDETKNKRQRVEVSAVGSTFNSHSFFKQNPLAPIPDLDFTASSCEFTNRRDLVWIQRIDAPTAISRFRWRGRETHSQLATTTCA